MKLSKIRKKLPLILPIIALVGLWFYARANSQLHNEVEQSRQFKSVDSMEFGRLLENDTSFVVDVHTPEQLHIPGTDAFIPYDQIKENADKLPEDKDTPLLVYCRSGSMSKQASQELVELGYSNVFNLEGGISAYRESHASVDISPKRTDLGEVIYGDVAKTSFTLTNFTPVKLSIEQISTSCSCTSASVEKRKLDPYESTTINVSFDPAVHKDDTDLGEIVRSIYVDTDNPNFERVAADITANVVRK